MPFWRLAALAVAPLWLAKAQNEPNKRTISSVVKLLQDMLEKAKDEGDTERKLYAKYKCYCDTNEEQKKSEIAQLTEQIQLLGSQIDAIMADNGLLSKAVAKFKAEMEANKQAQNASIDLREQEKTEFDAKKLDLETAIGQMKEAIDVLAEVGADQTLQSAGDHKQFMAGHDASLASLKTTVKKALLAASAFVSQRQTVAVESFIQAPFTGTYTAQSGEVVGILKDMRDTFEANLKSAIQTEEEAIAAHEKYIENMEKSYKTMETAYLEKQGTLSTNDSELGTKKTQLQVAEDDLESAEAFLKSLLEQCAAKATQYEERVSMRASEEAAISEAIAILNSDAAFATFGTVSATKDGPTQFLQYREIRRHDGAESAAAPRRKVIAFLQQAAGPKGSPLLGRVVTLLQANNPFAVVLEEIDKMIAMLAAEEKADDEQKAWCDNARTETSNEITQKDGQIITLQGEIQTLNDEIEHPVTGLKVQISAKETALQENHDDQVSQTKERTDDNLAYQKDVANLVEADALLTKAVKLLRAYYSKIKTEMSSGFIQKRHKRQTPPETWDDNYQGQSAQGGSAIDMLEFILSNTKKEEQAAHQAENDAQHAFEDSMTQLKTQEQDLQTSLVNLKLSLAEKSKELLGKEDDLKATTKEKETLEAYLEKIKPGCDFITLNIDARKGNRVTEKTALDNAKNLLTDSPAYKEAMKAAHEESLGKCKDTCLGDNGEDHVDCKACLAETSVPGYCAGHPGTKGC